jgi:hypothetical protein
LWLNPFLSDISIVELDERVKERTYDYVVPLGSA